MAKRTKYSKPNALIAGAMASISGMENLLNELFISIVWEFWDRPRIGSCIFKYIVTLFRELIKIS